MPWRTAMKMSTLYRMRRKNCTYKRKKRTRRSRRKQRGGQRAPLTVAWGGMLLADDRPTIVFRRPDPLDPTSVPVAMTLDQAREIANTA